MTIEQGLLAALTALVGALIWLVKANQSTSNRLIEQRDKEVTRLIQALEAAVEAFKGFELDSVSVFGKLLDRMDASQQMQELVLAELKEMNARISSSNRS